MNIASFASTLFAQAADVAGMALPAAPAVQAGPLWREPWAVWVITLLTVAVPTLLAWLAAKSLRFSDSWGRLATLLVAATAGAVITWMGWPPRLGIDLKGGVILVYEVDSARQSTGQVGDCAGRIEQLLSSQDGRKGTVSRMANNRITVRLETTDAALLAERDASSCSIRALTALNSDIKRAVVASLACCIATICLNSAAVSDVSTKDGGATLAVPRTSGCVIVDPVEGDGWAWLGTVARLTAT